MSDRTFLAAAALCGAILIACAWGAHEFVNLTLGAPPPCEVSNSCGRHR